MKKREQRRAEVRAAEVNGRPGVTLRVITPNIVDDYGSVFMPDAFDDSLNRRAPVLCWSHDWSEPLGPMEEYRTGDGGPDIDFAFSDFDAVPIARRAHAQVEDGTIVDCSVGFSNTQRRSPTKAELQRWPGAREVITKADLDEVSLVLRGAVPGAKVMSVRSAGGTLDLDAVVEIARRVAAGEITAEEAQAAVDLLTVQTEETDPAVPPEPVVEPTVDPDPSLDADLGDAVELVLGRARPWGEVRFPDKLASEVYDLLRDALRAKFKPKDNEWVWVRDHSDNEVIFDLEGFKSPGTFRLAYSLDDDKITFDGEAQQVVPRTTYRPK